MPTQVIMPQLGESVEEGTVSKWLKTIGDSVEEFEPLLEVNTDKVDTEIPAPAEGILLEILVAEGTTVQAGTLLAWIGKEGEQIPAGNVPAPEIKVAASQEIAPESPQAPKIASAETSIPAPGRERSLGFISPVVARIASEHNVDLFQVPGTGRGGRITKQDILAHIEARGSTTPPPPASLPVEAKTPSTAIKSVLTSLPQSVELLPLTNVRRMIAEHMVHSKRTSPHVTTIMEADLHQVTAHRAANKDAFARDGVKLTFTAYFMAAAVTALKAYPLVNSSWSEDGILLHNQINIGMATSLGEEGLIVPVIKQADKYSLLGLARTINDLASRARAKKLGPDEVQGGTFTITNHGISGSLFATPIINQPQCGILGIGAIQKRVVVVGDTVYGDMIAIRPMVYLSLTFDHRILDGAVADYFLAKVVESLQNWK